MPDPPSALHARAIDELRFIRSTMERAGAFTALPGWGGVAMGVTALAAGIIAHRTATDGQWLLVWLAEAVIATTIALVTISAKMAASGVRLAAMPTRRFALAFVPPLAAGAVLTIVFVQHGSTTALAGCWLLLYGTALTTGGALSVRVIPLMGVAFMTLGVVTFLAPAGWRDLFMAIGFGGLHIVFGVLIARRYGG